MSTHLLPFAFESNTIRVILLDDDCPWFAASDVANALGYARPNEAVIKHCKKSKPLKELGTLNQRTDMDQQLKMIQEPDVYRLIARSNLPAAERFQDWLFEEVLPSLRKTGKYEIHPDSPSARFDEDPALPTGTPFDRVQGAKLSSLLRISRKAANAYLAVCGVTPDYIETVAPSLPQGPVRGDSLTDALALLGSAGEWYAECLEYGFIVEGGEWPAFPLTTKAVQDAYSAWCRQRGRRDQGLVGLGRFLAGVGIKRRRPLVKRDGYSFQPNAYEFPPIEHARKLAEIKTGVRHGR